MRRKEIERLLPAIFQQTLGPGNFLTAALEVMEALHEPSEQALGRLDAFFDPRRTDDRFVPLLARWLDLERLFDESFLGGAGGSPISPGLGRLRELTARAAELSRWRGTARGLRLFLETATGVSGYEIEEPAGADARPFHLRVVAPAAAAPHRDLIERIIELEKPAYVTYDLEIART